MTEISIQDFAIGFNADIKCEAQSLDILLEHAFVEKMAEILCDYGEFENFEPCHWRAHGIKVDGFAFDDDFENLSLVVSHFLDAEDPSEAKVTNTEIDKIFKRAMAFFERSYQGKLKEKIEVSNPAQELATLIQECKESLTSLRIILVTDGIAEERTSEAEVFEGITVSRVIWDISRVNTFVSTGQREKVEIDFEAMETPIKCVSVDSGCSSYTAYLAFVPGNLLADLYGKWKIRLLERNVRVFLSQRPQVNQGIRDTIRDEPTLFCAYNNGITVYSNSVKLIELPCGHLAIASVSDFQIVNGGQTTASLYHTRDKYKADLSEIAVQMKLFVINEDANPVWLGENEDLSDFLLGRIGRFSNTQNKIQMADLLANDPPHPELHAISLNCAAPDPSGGSVQSFWFYEKARGSYEETRRLQAKTPVQKRKFDQRYPKKQRFDKNKFGKSWSAYRKQPHAVCLGAMKNFARFNTWIQGLENENWTEFFKKSVALVLLWNEAERLVRRQKFGGYTHAIVAYMLAWFHELTELKLDLDRIWRYQKVDERVLESLEVLAIEVDQHIRDTKLNVTEWCKKENCWDKLRVRKIDLPNMQGCLISSKSKNTYDEPAMAEAANLEFCKSKGASAWKELSKWLKDRDFMQGKQRSQCFNLGRSLDLDKKEPSPILCMVCKKIWIDAEQSYGWRPLNAPISSRVQNNNDVEAIIKVPGKTWAKIKEWGRSTGKLRSWQTGLAHSLRQLADENWVQLPTAKQAAQALKLLELFDNENAK